MPEYAAAQKITCSGNVSENQKAKLKNQYLLVPIFLIIVFSLSFNIQIYSNANNKQSNWDDMLNAIQEDFPEYILKDISVVDDSLWFVIGEIKNKEEESSSGIFLRSTDEGKSWCKKEFGKISLKALWFGDEKIGWMAGIQDNSCILIFHTMDCGENWIAFPFPVCSITKINNIAFDSDMRVGIIEGSEYDIMTKDGGQTWFLRKKNER